MTRLSLSILLAASIAAATEPPAIPREFRGVWIATVDNIDWPSKPGLPADEQKRELLALLDKAKELNLNAIVFQVRPMADALYESKLEPWSEYLTGESGKSPGYDPLAFAIENAHARGLELHAWFNPYRARHPSAKSPPTADHIVKKRPDLAKPYGTHHWMNPTHPEVVERSIAVILDVVDRYDVDGIHIDDYFYPYKERAAKDGPVIPFPDDDTWAKYEGKLSRDDWRRDAVNRFVARLYKDVKARKKWVKIGVSPFGIARPGLPKGITGLDQFTDLYADAKLWLNEGWIDYFSPQLYWPIAQEKQSFPRLLDWWIGENRHHRHLWPGLYTSRVTGQAKGWPAKEIGDQIVITRDRKGSTGVVHFSMKSLMDDSRGVSDVLKASYAETALVPESPWLADSSPVPELVISEVEGKLSIQAGKRSRFVLLREKDGARWKSTLLGVDHQGECRISPPRKGSRLSGIDRTGREGPVKVVGD